LLINDINCINRVNYTDINKTQYMTEQSRVLILGYGEMGHAMQYLLNRQQHLDIWTRRPINDLPKIALKDIAPNADFVLFCLPTNAHRKVAELLAPQLKKTCICLSMAKGLDESGQTAAQIFSDIFGSKLNYALLYGPMIAEEMCIGRYGFAQLGCNNTETYKHTKQLFHDTNLYIEKTTDITGISWAVILKNVYAILFGITDELQMGDNVRGYLAYAALRELSLIVSNIGGQMSSIYSLAGLADLITTVTSEDSHHHELGRLLARGETLGIDGEGVHTIKMVEKYQLFTSEKYPLFQLITNIIQQPNNLGQQIDAYLVSVNK
jgi:glycerol-3-phosphate dehydrogenase (NAD(P)+)